MEEVQRIGKKTKQKQTTTPKNKNLINVAPPLQNTQGIQEQVT